MKAFYTPRLQASKFKDDSVVIIGNSDFTRDEITAKYKPWMLGDPYEMFRKIVAYEDKGYVVRFNTSLLRRIFGICKYQVVAKKIPDFVGTPLCYLAWFMQYKINLSNCSRDLSLTKELIKKVKFTDAYGSKVHILLENKKWIVYNSNTQSFNEMITFNTPGMRSERHWFWGDIIN